MKNETKIWEDRIFPDLKDNLVISFKIPARQVDQELEIGLELFWKRNKDDLYIPGKLVFSKNAALEFDFANYIRIKGTLGIRKFADTDGSDRYGVFGDFYYYRTSGGNYIWHTEGFLVDLTESIVVEIIAEEIVSEVIVQKPQPLATESTPVLTSDYTDLFPYIYVSGWPKISRRDKKWNFFTYEPATLSPSVTGFTDQLKQLKSSANRQGIQQEAVSFAEGDSSYTGLYVENVGQLGEYAGEFLLLYSQLCSPEGYINPVSFVNDFYDVTTADFSAYLKAEKYLRNRERLWDSYFALLIEAGYDRENFAEIIAVLTTCNLLETIFSNLDQDQTGTTLSQQEILSLLNATILLPETIFPLPPYSSSPPVTAPTPILSYAIGDLQLVKYKLARYQVGELASMVSIMPGERRKSVNRKLDRLIEEDTTTTTSGTLSSTEARENSTTFNEELWDAIAETTEAINYPAPGMTSSYGPLTEITVSGSYTRTFTTQTPDKRQTSSFAKKVLDKTTQRLSEKISRVRSRTAWKESEDTSVSVVDNSHGKEPLYAAHCWLNKVYEAKVIRYGNRMLFSFIVPDPAKSFLRQLHRLEGVNAEKPKTFAHFNIASYKDITRENYLDLCQYYGLKDFNLYPENIQVSDIVLLTESKLISLPAGCYAVSASLDYAFGSHVTGFTVNGFLGQQTFSIDYKSVAVNIPFKTLNGEQGVIPVGLVGSPVVQSSPPVTQEPDFQAAVEILCSPTDSAILSWKIALFQQLEAISKQQLDSYYEKLGSSLAGRENLNPQGERAIVKQELEKGIHQQLLSYALELNGLPLDLINSVSPPDMQFNQPEIVQFLKASLEWDELSYTFLDHYGKNGIFAVSSPSSDFFQAFLQAKYARVMIPVNPAFNFSSLYFFSTGLVWPVSDVLAPCFDSEDSTQPTADQPSIVNELKKVFGSVTAAPEIIDEWEVVVPTSMQILQNKQSLTISDHV